MSANGPALSHALVDLLRIESVGDNRYRARLPGFGGVTLGCATLAAARTCPDRALHSLHTYFLRPVPTDRDVELLVERVRDGRRFAHRRVSVLSDSRLCCELMASFASQGQGVSYQEAAMDASIPLPETLTPDEEVARAEGWDLSPENTIGSAVTWRWMGTPWRPGVAGGPSRYDAWVRPRIALPSDAALSAAAIAFLSDYHSHWSVARKLNGDFEPWEYTSLDQVLWLHCSVPWDDWWLLRTESDVARAGRGFTRRQLYTRQGTLVASMAQEALIPTGPIAH
jgi:acyl-CoA thioesterase-2